MQSFIPTDRQQSHCAMPIKITNIPPKKSGIKKPTRPSLQCKRGSDNPDDRRPPSPPIADDDDSSDTFTSDDETSVKTFDKIKFAKMLAKLFPSKHAANKVRELEMIEKSASSRKRKMDKTNEDDDSMNDSRVHDHDHEEEYDKNDLFELPPPSIKMTGATKSTPTGKSFDNSGWSAYAHINDIGSHVKGIIIEFDDHDHAAPLSRRKKRDLEEECKDVYEPDDDGEDEEYEEDNNKYDDDDEEEEEEDEDEEYEEDASTSTGGSDESGSGSSSSVGSPSSVKEFVLNDTDDDNKPIVVKKSRQQRVTEQMRECELQLDHIKATKNTLLELLTCNPKNKSAQQTLLNLLLEEKKVLSKRDSIIRNAHRANVQVFKKLLQKRNSTNDLKYFKSKLSMEEQHRMIHELTEIHKVSLIEKPYRLALLESQIPVNYKAIALRKVTTLSQMDPGCGEYFKVKNWVDTFMKIPFGTTKNLPITMEDGLVRCSRFMMNAKEILDSAVYGMIDAKMQVMQMVGQWITNPGAMGTAIAIHGPAGCGKTTFVKEGISKILGRDFAFIALGGATDSSFLEGHSYTYEGSTWGKIVDILLHCNSMNPVIYFDELDKISETAKGEEIAGILTHLTDTSQNAQFHDKYFAEIHFDLSKCLFIFSYNDPLRVNPILLDRMYKIHTSGYNKKDKTKIAQNYLIPKIRKEVGFVVNDIIIEDDVIEYIIEHMTDGEEGVRNLKRCLEIIHTKLNLYRLIHPDTDVFEKELNLQVNFPFTVTTAAVDKLIKKAPENNRAMLSLYL